MKKLTLIAVLLVAACTRQTPQTEALPESVPTLDAALLPAYMKVLPGVLKASETFIQSPEGKASVNDSNNVAFYRYLYRIPNLAEALSNSGFPDEKTFGANHELVVAVFITLMENPDLLGDAESQLPALQKELDALTLRQSRDKNNASLNTTLANLQSKVSFYRNLTILAPYFDTLKSLNTP